MICTPSILMTTCRIFSSQKIRISKIAFSDYLTSDWYKTFKNMFNLCNFSVFEWFYLDFITIIGGVFFDLRKSAILHFWPTPNPLYYTSDLLARGFTAAIQIQKNSWRGSDIAVGRKFSRGDVAYRRCNITQ